MNARTNLYGMFILLCTLSVYAQDAHEVLEKASRAMGVDEMISIQYKGTGWVGAVGQNFTPSMDWPRLELSSYTRTIDFDSMSSTEELVIEQGDYPTRGGGGIPIQGQRHLTYKVRGDYAWDMQGDDIVPVVDKAEGRLLDIYLTPYGFIKGAMESDSTVIRRNEYGEWVHVVSFIAQDKYRINATFSEEGLMHRIQTWLPNPVVGDMYYETVFTNYKDIGGLKFPGRWHQHHDFDDGDTLPNVSGGDHAFGLENITEVTVNVRGAELDVPRDVRRANPPEVNVEVTELAEGVWLMGGGSHNSVVMEFDEYIAVFEAPQNEARSLAVIEEIYQLIDDKPIRFIINSHHHWDHLGGLRTYVHEGATVITHDYNKTYYQEVLRAKPWLLEPDRYSLFPLEEWSEGYVFETVKEKYVLADNSRRVDIHLIQGLNHVEGMLIAYLPEEKVVIEADLYSPRPSNANRPPNASNKTFYENLKRLKLDVETIVPIHGQPTPMSQFVEYMGE